MKNLLAVLIGLLISSGLQASTTNWSWEADTRIRHEIHNNPNGSSGGSLGTGDFSFTEQRTQLGLNFNQGEGFKGRVKLIHAFNWGDDGAVNTAADFNAPAGSTSSAARPNGISDQQNLLLVNEAWLWWKLTYSMSMRLGRGGMNMAGGHVISNNSDEVTPTSFDGAIIKYDHDMLVANFMYMKLVDGFNPATGTTQGTFTNDPESDFFGTSVDFKGMPEIVKHLNLHFLQTNTDDSAVTGGASVEELRYGLTLGGQAAGFSYSATYERHSGNSKAAGVESDTSGSMIDIMAKYDLPEIYGLFLLAGFHTDSGDDNAADTDVETYNSFFYDRHANAGLMDVLVWGNLSYYYFGFGATVMDFDVAVTYYSFTQTEKNATTNFGIHGSSLTSSNSATEDDLGSEIDVSLATTFDSGMKAGFRWGMFSPGSEFVAPNDETHSQYVFEVAMDF